LKFVNKSENFAFIDIEVNAGPCAKLVHKIKKDDQVLHSVGDESSAIRVYITCWRLVSRKR
jgi:hypothetical protein